MPNIPKGPSSIPYIIHSMPTLPISHTLSDYCMDKGFRMVRTEGLDGYISVTSEVEAQTHPPPPPQGMGTWTEAVDGLVGDYIDHIGELLPIVTASEAEQAGPVLRHAMAAVAATRSVVSPALFEAIRQSLPHELEQNGEWHCSWDAPRGSYLNYRLLTAGGLPTSAHRYEYVADR